MKRILLGLTLVALFFPYPLRAGDVRTAPMSINIIIDGSPALKNGKDEAVNWLCAEVVDGIVSDGDSLTIWLADSRAERLYSDRIRGKEDKEGVKRLLKSISPGDAREGGFPADFIGALGEAASRISGEFTPQNTYTILIGGSASSLSSALENDRAGLLRFFKTEEFPNWQALVIALGIAPQVQRAAEAYMNMGS
jgi:hypothetical protein